MARDAAVDGPGVEGVDGHGEASLVEALVELLHEEPEAVAGNGETPVRPTIGFIYSGGGSYQSVKRLG